jgi:hypothetical protein
MPARLPDQSGRRFGRLVALMAAKHLGYPTRYQCVCDCGKFRVVQQRALLNGATQSCGCLARERSAAAAKTCNTTHGQSKTREYKLWVKMKARCYNPRNNRYQYYGGRGITVCDRWRNSFEVFLADMGPCPAGYTIERKDVHLGYCPDNCIWDTQACQADNKTSSIRLTYQGKTLNVSQWAKLLGVNHMTLRGRIKRGWPVEKVLSVPIRPIRAR